MRLLAFLMVACVATAVYACPNCKSSVARDGQGMSLGFAWSILLMLMAPMGIISAWAIAIRRHLRRFQSGVN